MKTFGEFVARAIANEVLNDESDIWVVVDGIEASIRKSEVIETESYPFEASYILDNNPDHPAWDDLYDDYAEKYKEVIEEV